MKYNLDKSQFSFSFFHHGAYFVQWVLRRGDRYRAIITDMELIDSVRNVDYPSQKALRLLANAVKFHGTHYSKNEK